MERVKRLRLAGTTTQLLIWDQRKFLQQDMYKALPKYKSFFSFFNGKLGGFRTTGSGEKG
jgi:hypothetical protein